MKLKTYFFAFALIISIITAGCPKEDEDDNTNTNTNTGNTNTAQSNLTGTVSITGTPQTGKILTASTSNLGGSGTISYQWKRGDSSDVADTVISGAASATYTLTTDDEGKFIKVTVTRAGFLGNITSDAVGAVLPAQAPTPTVTSVTIDPETKSLLRGETQQFTATVTGTNDPAQSVTWSVEGGVTGTDITHDGILTVSAKEKAATLTVVAKSTFDKNKSGTATVTVLYPTVTSVSVSPSTISVNKGETWLFTATVNGANDPAQSVTWSVTGGISGTSINDNGLLTVAFGETAATLTVRATSTEDASKSGTATVTATTPPLTGSVSVSGTAQAGHTLTANTSNLVGSGNISYQWTSSDTSTGTFTNISGATSATYPVVPNDVGKHIKVTVTRAGYLGSVTSSNTVGPVIAAQAPTPTVTGVTVSPTTATLLKGATQQFTATVTGTNDPAQTVSWTVTGGGTGTGIDANGLLTVSTSQAAATLTVRATSTVDTSKSATATVTVPVPTVTSVTVTPSTATVNKTKTQQFTATVNGTNSPAQTVTWTVTGKTGNSTSISTNGLLTVSGNETAATFTVSATSTADASKSGTATVTIPALTGSVSVTGTAQIGQSALGVNISSLGGSGNIGYQWTSSSKETGPFTNISGATSQTYSLVSADEGKYIKVTVTRSENIGSVTSSNALGPVLLPALTGSVTISGTAQREQTLTANTSSLGGSGGTIGYEWTRADSTNGTYNNISGATAQTYKLVAADVGKFIKVTVTRTGYSGSITSEATTAVQQADEVVVSTIQDSTAFNGLTTPANNYNVVDLPPDNKTNVMKVSPTDKWAVAQYSLSAYKGKEITITLSVNVKRTGKAGTLNWQINNSNYPSVATQSNATVNTWYAMSGTWTGTPSDANPALYLNNDDKTTPGSTYYIDSFSVTIVEVSGGGNSGNFNGVTWTNADLGASTFQKTAKNGPYDVEMWNENRQGTASMTLGVNGAFKCSWDGINNVLFRAGRKYDKTKTHSQIGTFTIEYTATFDPGTVNGSRNSYLSVYGWVTGGSPDALIEYYIIEAKGEFDPGTGTGAVQVGNTNGVSIDGGTYKLYKVPRSNAPSIEGNKDFMQYFSVRTSNRTSGTISVSQHFAAWNSAGLTSINNGKLYEVSLKAESYGGTSGKSKGSAEITKNILKVGGNEIQ